MVAVPEPRSAAEKIATQHRLIDSQLARLSDALGEGALLASVPRIERLLRSIRAHFTLEEDFYFPRAEAESAANAKVVASLRAEHVELDRALSDVARHAQNDALEEARASFETFSNSLLAHERTELEHFAA